MPFIFNSLKGISPIYMPSERHLLPNSLISAQFSQNSPSSGVISSLAHFCICAFKKATATVGSQTGWKTSLSHSQSDSLLTAVPVSFCRGKFHPALHSSFIITHFSFTFSQLPHFCLSITFFPPSPAVPPLPPCSVIQMLPTFNSPLLCDTFSHICSVMTLLLSSLFLHKPFKMEAFFWLGHDPNSF